MIKNCKKCVLAASRKNIVIGEGSIPCDILFIGTVIYPTEDLLGRPFCGKSGLFLRRMLKELGILRKYKVYFTNTVLCKTPEGRPALPEEIKACRENVNKIIRRCKPKKIVCLGHREYIADFCFDHPYKYLNNKEIYCDWLNLLQ